MEKGTDDIAGSDDFEQQHEDGDKVQEVTDELKDVHHTLEY